MVQKLGALGITGGSSLQMDTTISYYQLLFSRFYSLVVVQQPIRARMCGFGDKVCQLQFLLLLPPPVNFPFSPPTRIGGL